MQMGSCTGLRKFSSTGTSSSNRGSEKPATRGYAERLGLQIWSVGLEGGDQASLASARAPIRGGCSLADCHLRRRLRPISRVFPSPSIHIHVRRRTLLEQPLIRQQAAARARRAKPGAKRRQGRAKRMPRQGGLHVGVSGWCNSSQTSSHFHQPPPTTCAAAAVPVTAAVPVSVPASVPVPAPVSASMC